MSRHAAMYRAARTITAFTVNQIEATQTTQKERKEIALEVAHMLRLRYRDE